MSATSSSNTTSTTSNSNSISPISPVTPTPEDSLNLFKAVCSGDINTLSTICKISPQLTTALFRLRDSQGSCAFLYAVANGRLEIVKLLIKSGIDVNMKNQYGWTALMLASYYNHLNIVKLLLEHPAIAVDMANEFGFTALMFAVQQQNTQIATALLAAGCNVNLRQGRGSMDALMISCHQRHQQLVHLLLQHGAECNAQCKLNGWTPLMYAAVKRGGADVVKMLIKHGADLQLRNWNGKTAEDVAIEVGNAEVAEIFAQHWLKSDFNYASLSPMSPTSKARHLIFDAITTNDVSQLLSIISTNPSCIHSVDKANGYTPLIAASIRGSRDILKVLLDYGSTLEAKDSILKWTALMHAVHNGHTDCVKLLLEKGANTDSSSTGNGHSVIELARSQTNQNIVNLLNSHLNNANKSPTKDSPEATQIKPATKPVPAPAPKTKWLSKLSSKLRRKATPIPESPMSSTTSVTAGSKLSSPGSSALLQTPSISVNTSFSGTPSPLIPTSPKMSDPSGKHVTDDLSLGRQARQTGNVNVTLLNTMESIQPPSQSPAVFITKSSAAMLQARPQSYTTPVMSVGSKSPVPTDKKDDTPEAWFIKNLESLTEVSSPPEVSGPSTPNVSAQRRPRSMTYDRTGRIPQPAHRSLSRSHNNFPTASPISASSSASSTESFMLSRASSVKRFEGRRSSNSSAPLYRTKSGRSTLTRGKSGQNSSSSIVAAASPGTENSGEGNGNSLNSSYNQGSNQNATPAGARSRTSSSAKSEGNSGSSGEKTTPGNQPGQSNKSDLSLASGESSPPSENASRSRLHSNGNDAEPNRAPRVPAQPGVVVARHQSLKMPKKNTSASSIPEFSVLTSSINGIDKWQMISQAKHKRKSGTNGIPAPAIPPRLHS
ncbi:ankyrin repeat-containing domain protein [Paraphysoderma sedebokerense]|nr:ankyrin repeat-containing domain protein [Paraphysoderma sedebokerense]